MKENGTDITPISRGKEIRVEKKLDQMDGVTKELFRFSTLSRELVVTAQALLEAERRKPQEDQDHALITRLVGDLSVYKSVERGALDQLISHMGSRQLLQLRLDQFRDTQDLKGLQDRLQELERESSASDDTAESA